MENKNSINFSDSLASEAYTQYKTLLEQTDGQNRCRRCNHKLSDPTAAYGPYCAQLLGLTVSSTPSDSSENKMSIFGESDNMEFLDTVTNLAYNEGEEKKEEKSQEKPSEYLKPLGCTVDELDRNPEVLNKYIEDLGGINTSNRPGSDTNPDSKPPINTFQILYGAYKLESDDKDKKDTTASVQNDRYDNYKFGVMDAMDWLIQTGGDVNFVLQLRDIQEIPMASDKPDTWKMKDEIANWQVYIINTFLEAAEILNNSGTKVSIPKFYLGAAEKNPKTLINLDDRPGIYEQVLSKLGSNKYVVAGAYFGEDNYKLTDDNIEDGVPIAKSISEAIHENYGGQMLWIPFFDIGHEDDKGNFIPGDENVDKYFEKAMAAADETHVCMWGERPIFDTIILQPGYFFYENGKGLGRNDLPVLANKINIWNASMPATKIGMELEFDMGVVTGRDDKNYSVRNTEKKERLPDYLKAAELLAPGTPIGIYSGGPNEQGYADPTHNENTHNTNNHIVQDSNRDKAVGNHKKYSKFPNSYNGNFIYELSDYIYRHFELGENNYNNERQNMSEDLREFLGIY